MRGVRKGEEGLLKKTVKGNLTAQGKSQRKFLENNRQNKRGNKGTKRKDENGRVVDGRGGYLEAEKREGRVQES